MFNVRYFLHLLHLLQNASHLRSQMIGQDDFQFISRFDTQDAKSRDAVVKENPQQLAKTFLNLLSSISKETTIQYLLTLLDDILQVNKKYSNNSDE